MKAFEQTIGVQLLRRTTRRIEPTQVGYSLYEHDAKMAVAREVGATDLPLSARILAFSS